MAERNLPITDQQRKLIMVGCAQLGLDDDARRALTAGVTGKSSTKDLSMDEANRVIRELESIGAEFEKRARPARSGNVISLISEAQKKKIGELIEEMGWDEERLVGFVKRQTGSRITGPVESIHELTLQEGQSIIEGLKGILTRQKKGVLDEDFKPIA